LIDQRVDRVMDRKAIVSEGMDLIYLCKKRISDVSYGHGYGCLESVKGEKLLTQLSNS
jgi:hypothetical protein